MRRGLYNRFIQFPADDAEETKAISINLGYDSHPDHQNGIESLKKSLGIDQSKLLRWVRAGIEIHRIHKDSSFIVRGKKYGLIIAGKNEDITRLKELITTANLESIIADKRSYLFNRNSLAIEGMGKRAHVGSWSQESLGMMFNLQKENGRQMFEDFSQAFKKKEIFLRLHEKGGLEVGIASRYTLKMNINLTKSDFLLQRQS